MSRYGGKYPLRGVDTVMGIFAFLHFVDRQTGITVWGYIWCIVVTDSVPWLGRRGSFRAPR